MQTGRNFSLLLEENSTLSNPTNEVAGQGGIIRITQDAPGGRTLAFGNQWYFPGGVPSISAGANDVDLLVYQVVAADIVLASLLKDFVNA